MMSEVVGASGAAVCAAAAATAARHAAGAWCSSSTAAAAFAARSCTAGSDGAALLQRGPRDARLLKQAYTLIDGSRALVVRFQAL